MFKSSLHIKVNDLFYSQDYGEGIVINILIDEIFGFTIKYCVEFLEYKIWYDYNDIELAKIRK